MKKKIIITVLIALMAIICMSVAACHTHKYEERVVAPTCTEDGYTEHKCSCGDSYRDSEVAARHTLNLVPEKTATCTEEGHSAYYECSACNKWFEGEDGQNEISDKDSVIIAKLQHNTSLVPEKAATCTEKGHSAYYECSACNKWFEGENGQNEIADKDSVIIAKLPHNYVDGVCTACGNNQPTEGLEYTQIEGKEEYAVTGIGDAIATDIVIADEYDGKPVTEIGKNAFIGNGSLTGVTIPNSVASIGHGAFKDCNSLMKVTIGSGVKSIEYGAFDGCGSLKDITIPIGVTSIDGSVFFGCVGLTEITIPNSVESIRYNVFGDCSSLSSIVVSEGNGVYHSDGNCLIDTKNKTIIAGCKNSVIPDDGSVTSIEAWAFRGCNGLTSINLPDSVESIGEYAFKNCSNLIDINLSSNLKSIGNCAFEDCENLKNINLPNGIISIGICAFGGCNNLLSVMIPDSIVSIDSYVFSNCDKLVYNEKGNLKYLGNSGNPYLCLMDTTSKLITNATIDDKCKVIAGDVFYNCSSLRSVTIGSGVKSIGYGAFYGCSSLMEVTIPDGITSIGYGMFEGCSSLKSVTLPNSVTSIGRSAFLGCEELTSITIPDSVTSIGDSAFLGCISLIDITIGSGVTSIGKNTFSGCSSLIRVTIPDSVESIGNDAFWACSSLLSVTIPSGVTSIGDRAFWDCGNLKSVIISDSVTSIGRHAFDDCDELTSVYYKGTEEKWNEINIDDANDALENAMRYYYSETEPTTDGNYWYYDNDGNIVVWGKE